MRIPIHQRPLYNSITRTRDVLTQTHGRTPSLYEISDELGVDPSLVENLLIAGSNPSSLDRPLRAELDSDTLMDLLRDTSQDDILVVVILRSRQARIIEMVKPLLNERELDVFSHRYGFITGYFMTLEEVANLPHYGFSREWARLTLAEAHKKIRNYYSHPKRIQDFLDLFPE